MCISVCLDDEKVEYSRHYGLRGSSDVKLLHCTALYVGGQYSASSDRYAQHDVVHQSVGRSFSLKVTGIAITPSTICARVDLTGDLVYFHMQSFKGLFSMMARVSRHQKDKPFWIFLKQR